MAQFFAKKISDGQAKAIECDDEGALRHVAEIKAAVEALSACISAGKVQVDTEINATLDPTGLATQATLSSIDGKVASSTITEYNITLTNANTEYSQALPANTKKVEFWSRNGYAVRYSFVTGKVATPTAPYLTVKANGFYESPGMGNLSSKTIYFATASAGDIIEMCVWS
jgi:hypothetical protein